MCGRKPGSEKQMADRHAVASGEEDRRHDDNIMRESKLVKENGRQQMKNNLTE